MATKRSAKSKPVTIAGSVNIAASMPPSTAPANAPVKKPAKRVSWTASQEKKLKGWRIIGKRWLAQHGAYSGVIPYVARETGRVEYAVNDNSRAYKRMEDGARREILLRAVVCLRKQTALSKPDELLAWERIAIQALPVLEQLVSCSDYIAMMDRARKLLGLPRKIKISIRLVEVPVSHEFQFGKLSDYVVTIRKKGARSPIAELSPASIYEI
jgi:hypothetical protein